MKSILTGAIIGLFALTASAQAAFVAHNQAGGKIVLTERMCDDPSLPASAQKLSKSGYSYGVTGHTNEFCWFYNSKTGTVTAIYRNAQVFHYPVQIFSSVD